MALLVTSVAKIWAQNPAPLFLSDFDDEDDWVLSVGSGAEPKGKQSLNQNRKDKKEGKAALEFTALHTSESEFNYVRISQTFKNTFDFSNPKSIVSFYFKAPDQSASLPYLTLRLSDEDGNFFEAMIHPNVKSKGKWVVVELSPENFDTHHTYPNLKMLKTIRFESNADRSDTNTSITYFFDKLVLTTP